MVSTFATQIRRLKMVADKLRRQLQSASSTFSEERGYYWSANWITRGLNGPRRYRSSRKQYDGDDA